MSALPFLLTVMLSAGARPVTTVLLQFDQKYSPEAITEMKHEVETILKDSTLQLDWRLMTDLRPADSFDDVMIIHFNGQCDMAAPPVSVEGGEALARTHTVNGEVLPFTDVLCGKVSASVRSAMGRKDSRRGNYILGRALGRVLSHEIYHIVARTRDHGPKGVTKSALSGAQLVGEHLSMSDDDIEKLDAPDSSATASLGGR